MAEKINTLTRVEAGRTYIPPVTELRERWITPSILTRYFGVTRTRPIGVAVGGGANHQWLPASDLLTVEQWQELRPAGTPAAQWVQYIDSLFAGTPTYTSAVGLFASRGDQIDSGIKWTLTRVSSDFCVYVSPSVQALGTPYKVVEEVEIEPGYWSLSEPEKGWNSRAQSIDVVAAPWRMSFVVPVLDGGVVAGAGAAGAVPTDDNRTTIAHGFELRDGAVMLFNNAPSPAAAVQALAPISVWTEDTVYALQADAMGRVTYLVNDVPVARTTNSLAGQDVVLVGVLHGAVDEITQPKIEGLEPLGDNSVNLDFEIELFVGVVPKATVDMELSIDVDIVLQKINVLSVDMELEPVLYAGDAGVLEVNAEIDWEVSATLTEPGAPLLGPMQEAAFAQVRMAVQMQAGVLVGEVAALNVTMTACTIIKHVYVMRANADTSMARNVILDVLMQEAARAGISMHAAAIYDVALVFGGEADARMAPTTVMHAVLQAGGRGGASMAVNRLLGVMLIERGSADVGFELQHEMLVHMHEVMAAALPQQMDKPAQVWSVSNTGASDESSTNYTDYPFSSFANIGGRYFGACDKGLFELEGGNDDGNPISAAIHLGERDLGTMAIKTLANAYVSVNADAPMRLMVGIQDQHYTYMTRGVGPDMQTQRFDLGRGLRGHYFELQLMNTDGADFELGGIDFVAQESKRRI